MNTTAADSPDPASHAIAPETWRTVTLDAPDTLALYGAQKRGHLDVTLTNGSNQPLDPASCSGLVLSYRMLDAHGALLELEGVRTALTGAVAPGARHQQKITVIIPGAALETAVAIRISLLVEGQYWVDSLHPAHAKMVTLEKPEGLTEAESRLAAASQIWPQRQGNGMRWPYGTIMVSERHKLMYIPVAKCACTSLKSMMVELAGVDRAAIALELGVHFVTDRFNTGVQLKDKPIDEARSILASDQYFKFSVIRDPFERLVSAYLEKFVYKRHSQRNLMHTRPVISHVQGTADIDLQQGISFDQFMEYILGQDAYDLDAHWRPQHLYFRGVPHISHIYRLEQIAELEQDLLQKLGITVKLGHENKTGRSALHLPQASSFRACEFDDREAFDPESFMTTPHADAIRQYYREDFEFYKAAG